MLIPVRSRRRKLNQVDKVDKVDQLDLLDLLDRHMWPFSLELGNLSAHMSG